MSVIATNQKRSQTYFAALATTTLGAIVLISAAPLIPGAPLTAAHLNGEEALAAAGTGSTRIPGDITNTELTDTLRSNHRTAFTHLRKEELTEARNTFAVLRRHAQQLARRTGVGISLRLSGTPFNSETATPAEFEREAAYHHAVLTAALALRASKVPSPKSKISVARSVRMGARVGRPEPSAPTLDDAAKEYLALIKEFPESEQAAKAIRRLAKLHGGELLPHEQKAWEAAQKTSALRERERRRARSLCGPEVVLQLLRRSKVQGPKSNGGLGSRAEQEGWPNGAPAAGPASAALAQKASAPSPASARPTPAVLDFGPGTLDSLAREMKADEFGTTVASVQQALERRGYRVKGLRLSLPALWSKELPAVALLKEGHFVIVERIAEGRVDTWDPDVDGFGADGAKSYGWPQFQQAWTGMALVID